MDAQTQAILDAALALPEAQRVLLTERLLESISPDDPEDLSDEEFAAELQRRRQEVVEGKADLVPWSQLKGQV